MIEWERPENQNIVYSVFLVVVRILFFAMDLLITKNSYTANSNFNCNGIGPIDWIGCKLMWLTNLMVCEGIKVGKRIQIGQKWQEGSLANEVGIRMLRVVLVISLLWSIVPFCVGGCMRLFASLFKRDFIFLHPQGYEKKSIDSLTICTFNTALMPSVGSVVNGVPPPEDRVQKIVREILSKGDQIVCLQECFDATYSQKLVDGLANTYPYIIHHVGPSNFGFGSGLTLASKVPISAAQFVQFNDSAGDEIFANKGCLAVTLDVGSGRHVNLMTTHLQADVSSADASVIRKKQIEQMARVAKLYQKRHPALCFLVCGDFNIPPHSGQDWECLDRNVQLLSSTSSTLWEVDDLWRDDDPKNWERQESMQVDHIGVFCEISGKAFPLCSDADAMDGSSDHLAVRGKINF